MDLMGSNVAQLAQFAQVIAQSTQSECSSAFRHSRLATSFHAWRRWRPRASRSTTLIPVFATPPSARRPSALTPRMRATQLLIEPPCEMTRMRAPSSWLAPRCSRAPRQSAWRARRRSRRRRAGRRSRPPRPPTPPGRATESRRSSSGSRARRPLRGALGRRSPRGRMPSRRTPLFRPRARDRSRRWRPAANAGGAPASRSACARPSLLSPEPVWPWKTRAALSAVSPWRASKKR